MTGRAQRGDELAESLLSRNIINISIVITITIIIIITATTTAAAAASDLDVRVGDVDRGEVTALTRRPPSSRAADASNVARGSDSAPE